MDKREKVQKNTLKMNSTRFLYGGNGESERRVQTSNWGLDGCDSVLK